VKHVILCNAIGPELVGVRCEEAGKCCLAQCCQFPPGPAGAASLPLAAAEQAHHIPLLARLLSGRLLLPWPLVILAWLLPLLARLLLLLPWLLLPLPWPLLLLQPILLTWLVCSCPQPLPAAASRPSCHLDAPQRAAPSLLHLLLLPRLWHCCCLCCCLHC
jgi:hypothetical protein